MERNQVDVKVPDFMWNRNRLLIEKQMLKENMKKAIMKPIKKNEGEPSGKKGEMPANQGEQKWLVTCLPWEIPFTCKKPMYSIYSQHKVATKQVIEIAVFI